MVADKPVRVLIVDDSALIRNLLGKLLGSDPEIEVVGTANDPYQARDEIKRLKPDVLTLDVEMPKMDGLTFLRNLMRLHPMPVVMVSTLTEAGAEVTLDALALGAVDFIAKPRELRRLEDYADELIGKVKAAARVPVARLDRRMSPRPAPSTSKAGRMREERALIAMGASTGGTEALLDVLSRLPASMPPIVVTQHIPAMFSGPFARRLDRSCALKVQEAGEGEEIRPGHVYIAPGSHHLIVRGKPGRFRCHLDDGPPVNRHRPSVDVLFQSVMEAAGDRSLGVLLTGMGADGARGLLEMLQAGAETIAQDEKTSVVWGMPGAAVRCGAAAKILPLGEIAQSVHRWAYE